MKLHIHLQRRQTDGTLIEKDLYLRLHEMARPNDEKAKTLLEIESLINEFSALRVHFTLE